MSYELRLQALCNTVQRVGRHAAQYLNSAVSDAPSITLNTYRPANATSDSPIVLVQHGVMRNGDDYCDFWIPAAEEHGLVIIAPTFSNEKWPDVVSYNNPGCQNCCRLRFSAGYPHRSDISCTENLIHITLPNSRSRHCSKRGIAARVHF